MQNKYARICIKYAYGPNSDCSLIREQGPCLLWPDSRLQLNLALVKGKFEIVNCLIYLMPYILSLFHEHIYSSESSQRICTSMQQTQKYGPGSFAFICKNKQKMEKKMQYICGKHEIRSPASLGMASERKKPAGPLPAVQCQGD